MRLLILLAILVSGHFTGHSVQIRAITENKTMVIAVIDSGFSSIQLGVHPKLCKYGHKNFSPDETTSKEWGTVDPVPVDTHGHGTNVVGLIEKNATIKDYCIVVIKFWSNQYAEADALNPTIDAIKYATNIGAKIINYSGGGKQKSNAEIKAVTTFINGGGTFVAAAGNEAVDLEEEPFYPAMDDDRVIVVGSVDRNGSRSIFSNYGTPVKRWENGQLQTAYSVTLSGTSQAAAVATGKIINTLQK